MDIVTKAIPPVTNDQARPPFAELVLKSNKFECNGRHYLQKRGTAIGTRMAPSYANIFMDRLERRLIQNAEVKPHIWWWYIGMLF